jgi:5'-nucleotidase
VRRWVICWSWRLPASRLRRGAPSRSVSTGEIISVTIDAAGVAVTGYGVDASPAQAVEHALFELAPRPVNLVVSGINYGENVGEGLAVSGTLGAAIEAASFGIPALASLAADRPGALSQPPRRVGFQRGRRTFCATGPRTCWRMACPPASMCSRSTCPTTPPATPWRWTRQSRRRYFVPVPPQRTNDHARRRWVSCCAPTPLSLEPDSDVRAVILDRVVSITPVSIDMTANVAVAALASWGDIPEGVRG